MPTAEVKFGPDSGPSRSRSASAGGLINCFVEAAPDSKTAYTIYSMPGLKRFSDTGSAYGCRGGIKAGRLGFYVVFGETVYKVNSGGSATAVGTVYGTDNVSMAFNKADPIEIAIVASGRQYLLVNDLVTEIADADLPAGAIDVVYLDGHFIFFYSDGVMYQSALNDGTSYSALDFAEAEAKPDPSRAGGILGDRLVNFGEEGIEFFYNSGAAEGFSFDPQAGSLIDRGILEKKCWADFDNSLAWIDNEGIVVRGEGTIGKVIGSYPVHKDIQAIIRKQKQSEVVVSTWALAGHEILQIWSPDWCWCYDASSQKWFQRKTQDRDTWAGKFFFRVFNRDIVADAETGILYEQDDTTYGEDGKQLICSLTSNYVHAGPQRVRHNFLYLDIETGVGDAEDPDSEDVTPEIMLTWSNDGGKAYEGDRQISIGAQGEYRKRIKVTRLGMSSIHGRAYRIEYSAARPFTFNAAYADVTELRG